MMTRRQAIKTTALVAAAAAAVPRAFAQTTPGGDLQRTQQLARDCFAPLAMTGKAEAMRIPDAFTRLPCMRPQGNRSKLAKNSRLEVREKNSPQRRRVRREGEATRRWPGRRFLSNLDCSACSAPLR